MAGKFTKPTKVNFRRQLFSFIIIAQVKVEQNHFWEKLSHFWHWKNYLRYDYLPVIFKPLQQGWGTSSVHPEMNFLIEVTFQNTDDFVLITPPHPSVNLPTNCALHGHVAAQTPATCYGFTLPHCESTVRTILQTGDDDTLTLWCYAERHKGICRDSQWSLNV